VKGTPLRGRLMPGAFHASDEKHRMDSSLLLLSLALLASWRLVLLNAV
jgi:hypothetical protein